MNQVDFREERLATFIPTRFFMAGLVNVVVLITWLIAPSDPLYRFLIVCVLASSTGSVYWLLFKLHFTRLAAYLFAPLDFLLISLAVAVTQWAVGGLLIFHMWSIITAGVVLRPYMSVVFGVLSILVTLFGLTQRGLDSGTSLVETFEFFHSLGVVVVTWVTYALVSRLDETVLRQQIMKTEVEREVERLDAEVARRTDALVRLTKQLEDNNTLLVLQRRQAEEVDRLKSRFLASMSHELRNPLNAINGFADLMAQGIYGPVTRKQQERLANILGRTRELLLLVDDVLELAQLEIGRLELRVESFDPSEILRAISRQIEPQLAGRSSEFEFTLSLPLTPFYVKSDPARYHQIVLNVVQSVLKLSESGSVTVSLDNHTDGSFVTFVKEVGHQDAPDLPEMPLDPEHHLEGASHRQRSAASLGLYVGRQVASFLQGAITVSSSRQQGTSYAIRLPRQAPVLAEDRSDRPERNTIDGYKSLVSELEEQLRTATRHLRGFFDYSPFPLFMYDRSGTLIDWNPACEKLVPGVPTVLHQTRFQEVLYPDGAARANKLLHLVFDGNVCRMAWRRRQADGQSISRVGVHYPVLSGPQEVLYAIAFLIEPVALPLEIEPRVLSRVENDWTRDAVVLGRHALPTLQVEAHKIAEATELVAAEASPVPAEDRRPLNE